MNILTSIFTNPQVDPVNHRSLETYWLKQLFIKNNQPLDFVGVKGRNVKHVDYFKNFDCDLSQTKNCIIQLSPPNFYGGIPYAHTYSIITKLADLNCKFIVLVNDPRIKPLNPAVEWNRRQSKNHFSLSIINRWDEILNNAEYWFQGKNINQFWSTDRHYNVHKIDLFSWIFKNQVPTKNTFFSYQQPKKWDLAYWGNKRGGYREKKIKHYCVGSNDVLIGYPVPSGSSCNFLPKQNHDKLQSTIDQSKASLIIGDKEHENNIATFRFYETMLSTSLMAIDLTYDPNKELIQNPTLKDLLYVNSRQDCQTIIDSWSPELVKLQQQEFQNHMSNLKLDLNV